MSAPTDSCSSPILEPDRSVLLQEALADSQLQAVKSQLESRGFSMNADEAQAVQLASGQQLLIPFGEDAHLVWTRTNGQTAAVGLIRQGNKTLNISTTGEERVVRFLNPQKVEKLLRKLREKSKFQEFEGKLAQKGKRVGKIRVLFDETDKVAILGIASEGDEKKIAHQVRIKIKAGKDDELEEGAEPAIQATACGQATGEAVPMGAKMQPLALDPGDGGDLIGSSYDGSEGPDYGPQICTSQWGYDYICLSRYPMLMVSTGSLALPQTFITQQVQASFVIWNGGGGRLSGTVSVPAPFSIASGASFSLLPGQPQEVVVRFSSATPGSFSKSVSISSNGGSETVTATAVAHKVSFSPATLDFGSGLLLVKTAKSCTGNIEIGDFVCSPVYREEVVGLPQERMLTVKNEGSVAVTLTLSTAAPYKIVSVLPTLSPGQSAQVTVRFDPSESGNFTGAVQVGISGGQGSVSSSPLIGVAHKIKIDPAEIYFGIAFVGSTKEKELMIENQGVTNVPLNVSTAAPFSIMSESSFTLAPSEGRKITVRFSPTEIKNYTGVVRLSSGTVLKEFPIIGISYDIDDYLSLLTNVLSSYNVIYASDTNQQCQVLFAGISNLDFELMQDLVRLNGCETPQDDVFDPARAAEIQHAFELLVSLNPAQIDTWLRALAQALQENRFDEEYQLLLSQGFDKLVEATLLLLDMESDQGQEQIRQMIGSILEGGDPLDSIRWMQQIVENKLYQHVTGNLGSLQVPNLFWSIWKGLHWDPLKNAWDSFISLFIVRDASGNPILSQEGYNLSYAIMIIGSNMAQNLKFIPSPTGLDRGIDSFTEFLNWAVADINKRQDQAIGTLYSLKSAALNGWQVHPFQVLSNGFAAGVLLWPDAYIDGHRNVMVLLRGDNCIDCAKQVSKILFWVAQAISYAGPEGQLAGALFYKNDLRIIVLVFTNENAGFNALVNELQQSNIVKGSEVPIFAVGFDESGQPKVVCISADACRKLAESDPDGFTRLMQKLEEAFLTALRAYPNLDPDDAWWMAFGICGNDIDCILFLAEQHAKLLEEERCNPEQQLCPE